MKAKAGDNVVLVLGVGISFGVGMHLGAGGFGTVGLSTLCLPFRVTGLKVILQGSFSKGPLE